LSLKWKYNYFRNVFNLLFFKNFGLTNFEIYFLSYFNFWKAKVFFNGQNHFEGPICQIFKKEEFAILTKYNYKLLKHVCQFFRRIREMKTYIPWSISVFKKMKSKASIHSFNFWHFEISHYNFKRSLRLFKVSINSNYYNWLYLLFNLLQSSNLYLNIIFRKNFFLSLLFLLNNKEIVKLKLSCI